MASNPLALDNLVDDAGLALEKRVLNQQPRMLFQDIRDAATQYARDIVKERPIAGLLGANPILFEQLHMAEGTVSIAEFAREAIIAALMDRLTQPIRKLHEMTYQNRYLEHLCSSYEEALNIIEGVQTRQGVSLLNVQEFREYITDFRAGDGQDALSLSSDFSLLYATLVYKIRKVVPKGTDVDLDRRIDRCAKELLDVDALIETDPAHYSRQIDINRIAEQHKLRA